MIDVNRQGEVWVFAEQEEGQLSDVPLELLSKGRDLADKLRVPLASVLLGHNVKEMCDKLIHHGADKVYLVDDLLLESYQTVPYASAICQLIEKHRPQIMIYGATPLGRDLAPRVASQEKCGLTADCTDLDIGDYHVERTGEEYKDLLLQIRPAFGGNIIATIVNFNRWPQMATVREGVMRLADYDQNHTGEIIEEKVDIDPVSAALKVLERHREPRKVNLKAARIIVCGGAGVGSKENFKLIWDLANALGGAPAGSRAAVDGGFIDRDHQVGQTGTTVRPPLYIACGVSGAIQHRAGMQESGKIVAINTDSEAPILSIAHYAIMGDLNEVIPKFIKAVKTRA
jgi:electron transfer flavoprotein alpha subunit